MDNQLTDMITSLLSNPQGLDAIKGIINGSSSSNEQGALEKKSAPDAPITQMPDLGDLNFLTKLLTNNQSGVNALLKMKKAYEVYNNNQDPGINLINALSPYLSSKRAVNAGKIINAVKVTRAINSLREE